MPSAKSIKYDGSLHGPFGTDKDRFCDDLVTFLGRESDRNDEEADQRQEEPG